jgi:hypothetical protein
MGRFCQIDYRLIKNGFQVSEGYHNSVLILLFLSMSRSAYDGVAQRARNINLTGSYPTRYSKGALVTLTSYWGTAIREKLINGLLIPGFLGHCVVSQLVRRECEKG